FQSYFSSDSDTSLARVVRSHVSNSEKLSLFAKVEFDVALSFFAFEDNLNKMLLHQEHKFGSNTRVNAYLTASVRLSLCGILDKL
ncbi:34647_t:CDS:2, partial [Racocetra persica]